MTDPIRRSNTFIGSSGAAAPSPRGGGFSGDGDDRHRRTPPRPRIASARGRFVVASAVATATHGKRSRAVVASSIIACAAWLAVLFWTAWVLEGEADRRSGGGGRGVANDGGGVGVPDAATLFLRSGVTTPSRRAATITAASAEVARSGTGTFAAAPSVPGDADSTHRPNSNSTRPSNRSGGRTDAATTTRDPANWSHPFVHVVNTRFMQGQGSLTALARSRLRLFEAVCLPSMLGQTLLSPLRNDRNRTAVEDDPPFVWIIKIDPNMDPSVVSEMRAMLEPARDFAILMGSLTNFGVGAKDTGGWRDGQAGEDVLSAFRDGRVYFPDNGGGFGDRDRAWDVISRAHELRSERAVLETRIDADDGLNVEYLGAVQDIASRTLVTGDVGGEVPEHDDGDGDGDDESDNSRAEHGKEEREGAASARGWKKARWMYMCALTHVEWNPSTALSAKYPGTLSLYGSPNYCITPGLTLGFAVGTDAVDVPRMKHTEIIRELSAAGNGKDDPASGCGFRRSEECVVLVDDPPISAIRSRTVTSAGMHDLAEFGASASGASKEWRPFSEKMWKRTGGAFGIPPEKAWRAAEYMMDHIVDTVRDNLRGQCSQGHSCKISSLETLQRTVDIMEERDGGIEVGS